MFLFLFVFGMFYIYLESQLPDVESLKNIQLQIPLKVYTKDGLLIQEYGEKRRIPVTYEEIPKTLIYAVLATEDQRYFDHKGIDVFGLARAGIRMMKTGTKSQGGSTITMQVARNFFLDRKKTFLRKFNEILLAIKIDHEFSKEKILELYLNKIYLGNRAYGVGAAAQIYYGKQLKELNLAQLAMLAGLPQAPSTQNPIANKKAAKKRRDHVLERLLEEKYITKAQFDEAINEPIETELHSANIEVNAPYVAEMIRQSLYDNFGEAAYTKGYKVYTTLDSKMQQAANQVIEKHLIAYDERHGYRGPIAHMNQSDLNSPENIHKILKKYPTLNTIEPAVIYSVSLQSAEAMKRDGTKITIPWRGLSWARPTLRNGWVGRHPSSAQQIIKPGDIVSIQLRGDTWHLTQIPEVEAALVALNPNNGAIQALVGGFNFQKSKYNRATQSTRQPGSNFKPFIYAAALNKGYSLATQVNDAPIVVSDPSLGEGGLWRPRNDNLKFNGPTRLKEGLIRSRNLVSIRILDNIGIKYATDFMARFGFNPKSLPHSLSLALGTLSVTPMDLATAYATFANGGLKVTPYLINEVTDNDGQQLIEANSNQSNHAPRILSEDVAFLMNSCLMDVIKHGTAKRALELNRQDVAGKTGTTNDQFDAWFSGYNPDLVATTWVGFDTPQSLHEYGAQVALPLWIDFMKIALAGKPEHFLPQPENIVTVKINPDTGLQTSSDAGLVEYFRKDEIPSMDEGKYTAQNSATDMKAEEDLF